MLFVWIVDFADGGHGTEKKRLSTLFVHDPRPNCMTKREVLLVDVSTQCTKIINACVEEMDLKLLAMIYDLYDPIRQIVDNRASGLCNV